jgi:DNA-binding GntR family transcriptional regulator
MKELIVDLDLSRRLGMQPGTRWLRVGTLRADPSTLGRSLCWSDIYIEAQTGKQIRDLIRRRDELICNLVQGATGRIITEVQQRIRAIGVPKELAKRLGTEPDATLWRLQEVIWISVVLSWRSWSVSTPVIVSRISRNCTG